MQVLQTSRLRSCVISPTSFCSLQLPLRVGLAKLAQHTVLMMTLLLQSPGHIDIFPYIEVAFLYLKRRSGPIRSRPYSSVPTDLFMLSRFHSSESFLRLSTWLSTSVLGKALCPQRLHFVGPAPGNDEMPSLIRNQVGGGPPPDRSTPYFSPPSGSFQECTTSTADSVEEAGEIPGIGGKV